MRSGDPFTVEITFDEGFPDATISYSLKDEDGNSVTSGTVTPTAGDVSAVINISGTYNTLTGGVILSTRELKWSYTVGGLVKGDYRRYNVEAFLPFGVSRDGVRTKLGLTTDEAPDEEIDLATAYLQFEDTVTSAVLSAATGAYLKLKIRHGIEALAGLKMIPALQIKLAKKEVSGVSQFQRADIDWAEVAAYLNELLADAYQTLNPATDFTALGSSFLIVVRDPDPVTGATPS